MISIFWPFKFAIFGLNRPRPKQLVEDLNRARPPWTTRGSTKATSPPTRAEPQFTVAPISPQLPCPHRTVEPRSLQRVGQVRRILSVAFCPSHFPSHFLLHLIQRLPAQPGHCWLASGGGLLAGCWLAAMCAELGAPPLQSSGKLLVSS